MNPARASASAHCELLFELFSGVRGKLFVGRLLKGPDSGRIVTLRQVSQVRADLPEAVDAARSLAHPRLAKVLGLTQVDGTKFIASEYVPGSALCELSIAARQQQKPVQPAVAVQILSEGLQSLALVQELLRTHTGVRYTRSLHSDTVWIAEYGDVLVTEVGLATFLGPAAPSFSEHEAASRDVVGAAVELFQLLTARPLTVEESGRVAESVPAPLAALLSRAFSAPDTFDGPQGLADALSDLPPTFRASEDAIAVEVRRFLGSTLEKRRQTLRALQEDGTPDGDDSTQRFRTADLLGVGFRKEARAQSPQRAIPLGRASSSPPLPARPSDEPDEETLVFRDPRSGTSPTSAVPSAAPLARSEAEDDRTLVDRPAFASIAEESRPNADDAAISFVALDDSEADSSIFRPGRARARLLLGMLLALALALVACVWLQPTWLSGLLPK